MKNYSYVFNAHPSFIDEMYKKYSSEPTSVEEGWRVFFEGFEFGDTNGHGESGISANGASAAVLGDALKEFGVQSIIRGFRSRGHLLSTTNPIRERRDRKPHLDLADYGLSDADLNTKFQAGAELGLTNATLSEIIQKCKTIYAGNIGFEYAYIENRAKRTWLREQIEKRAIDEGYGLDISKKKQILK